MSLCLLGCNVQNSNEIYYSMDKTRMYTQLSPMQEFISGFIGSVTQATYPDSWNKKASTRSYSIVNLKSLQNDQVYPCLIKLGAHDLVVESCMNS